MSDLIEKTEINFGIVIEFLKSIMRFLFTIIFDILIYNNMSCSVSGFHQNIQTILSTRRSFQIRLTSF